MQQSLTDEAVVTGLLRQEEALTNHIVLFLYEAYKPATMQVALANSGSAEQAEDLFQEVIQVFLAAVWAGRFTYQGEGGVRGYLRQTASRIWQKELARRKNHQRRAGLFAERFLTRAETPTPERDYLDAEEVTMGWQLFRQLKPDEQHILDAVYGQEKSMQEVADELGLSNREHARVKKFRAVQSLKKLMNLV